MSNMTIQEFEAGLKEIRRKWDYLFHEKMSEAKHSLTRAHHYITLTENANKRSRDWWSRSHHKLMAGDQVNADLFAEIAQKWDEKGKFYLMKAYSFRDDNDEQRAEACNITDRHVEQMHKFGDEALVHG